MADIIVERRDELERITTLRGLRNVHVGGTLFVFRNDAFAMCQGARVHQNATCGFRIGHTLRNGAWHATGEQSYMGENEFLFYLEHLLPFAKAAQLVRADAVSAVMDLWVDAAQIHGMNWRVRHGGLYEDTDRWTVFDLSVDSGPSLRIGCLVIPDSPCYQLFAWEAEHSAWRMKTKSDLHELFQTHFRGLRPFTSALAMLERVSSAVDFLHAHPII